MSKKKEYSDLMDKGDNLWKKSFEPGQNSDKLKRKAKKYYRQADYVFEEASAPKVDNRKTTIKPTYQSNKFSLFGSLFGFGKTKKAKKK